MKMENKELILRFYFKDSDDLSPEDLVSFFRCIDSLVREVARQEARQFLEKIEFPRHLFSQVIRDADRYGKSPARIVDFRKNSPLTVVVNVDELVILYFAYEFSKHLVKDAWSESRLKEIMVNFIRDHAFLGAKKAIDNKTPTIRHGSVALTESKQLHHGADGQLDFQINVRKMEVITPGDQVERMMKEFMEK